MRLAFFNLLRNKRRTALLVLFIAVCSAALAVFVGYSEYTRMGMKFGAITRTGHFAIARGAYWNASLAETDTAMSAQTVENLQNDLADIPGISINVATEFSGLIGTPRKSAIFTGSGYSYIESVWSTFPVDGLGVFGEDADQIMMGKGLAEILGVSAGDTVELTVSTPGGIALYSQSIAGIVSMPDRTADKFTVFTNITNAWNLLGAEGSAHAMYVTVDDDAMEQQVLNRVTEILAQAYPDLSLRTWQELNPTFVSVMKMYRATLLFLLFTFSAFVFIALLQTMITISLERTKEFGTLRALGLTRRGLTAMLLQEVAIIAAFGIGIGLGVAYGIKNVVGFLGIYFTPPGSTVAYPIDFYFIPQQIVEVVVVPLALTLAASCIYPIIRMARMPVVRALEGSHA